MSETVPREFQAWAIVELFGHTKVAGRVSEQQIAGAQFLRVDVPGTADDFVFTRYYGASAVYSITPVDEAIAKAAAETLQARAVTVWMPQLEHHPWNQGDEDEDEAEDQSPPF